MIDNLTPVIGYQEPAWLTIAFFLGFAAKQIGLPPMVGFLGAGFALSGLGGSSGPFLQAIADLGVTLLLFSIGLKLDIRSLLRAEIWATTLTHMAVTVVLLSGLGMMLMVVGVTLFSDLTLQTALIAAFALSFSSTVFAVKVLEAKGEMASRHGRIAI
ncbi:MAG: cation:proton antiporter domain-containing protein, partial [bacterium]